MKNLLLILAMTIVLPATAFSSTLTVAQQILSNDEVMNEARHEANAYEFKSIEVTSLKGDLFKADLKFSAGIHTCLVSLSGVVTGESSIQVTKISEGGCGY